MQVQIIESNRGGKIALHDGHSYNQKQSTNNCIHWRCRYIKSTYIENPIVNKKPPFPIEIWNQYDAAGEGVARTTNSVEGWHYGLQAYFSGSSPNIWLLLRNLEKDSKMQKLKYVQETAGLLCSKRPRYEKIEKTDAKYPKHL